MEEGGEPMGLGGPQSTRDRLADTRSSGQGGPLSSAERVSSRVRDRSFAQSVPTIELGLEADRTSRSTWILASEGRAFIPCSLAFPPGKRWHLRVDRDGRAIRRIRGKRYRVTLERVQDPALEEKLKAVLSSKYGTPSWSGARVRFFAVEPRGR